MKPLLKSIALAVIVICALSFNKKETKPLESALNLKSINIDKVLSMHQFECRPSSDFNFDVETSIIKKIRGGSNIKTKVFIVDKTTGRKKLLAQENIQVKNFKDAIAIKDHGNNEHYVKNFKLVNGDKIVGSQNDNPYNFQELIQYDFIYNKYIRATNKLLHLKRSI
ncbi:hypothetical protein [Polaribacter sp.]|uniref:hypothetical protein n=1 Tax=Polaribacter sp. TaxID=1920175 RepID=UPI003F6B93A9